MKHKLAICADGMLLALGIAACGSGGGAGGHDASYQHGFDFGKSTKWYGSDNCPLTSQSPLIINGDDAASWLKGCEDGLKQATS
jgi:hypothetical protein